MFIIIISFRINLQVLHVELGGSHAAQYEKDSDCKWPLWLLILLAVAGAIGLFLMILACCCVS